MFKNKLLPCLVMAGIFSGYALADTGPTLNKTLSASLKQNTALSVTWEPSKLFNNFTDAAWLGTLQISSSGLSSITVKPNDAADATRTGTLAFNGPNGDYIISNIGTTSAGVVASAIRGGFKIMPPTGANVLPPTFNLAIRATASSSPGSLSAGNYTTSITVDSIVF